MHQQYCTVDTAAQLHIRQPNKGSEQLDRALAKDPDGTMKMAAVAEGGRTSESVVLSNGGKDVRHFEFTPQLESNLHISPMHGSLSPGEQRRITIEFRAPTEEEEPEPEAEAEEVPVVAEQQKGYFKA